MKISLLKYNLKKKRFIIIDLSFIFCLRSSDINKDMAFIETFHFSIKKTTNIL
jgi:hypothetical protein